MSADRTCPQCGVALPANAPEQDVASVLPSGEQATHASSDRRPEGPQNHSQAEALRAGRTTSGDPRIRRTEVRAPIRAGRPYFVMELVCGIRITDYCDQTPNLGLKDGIQLGFKSKWVHKSPLSRARCGCGTHVAARKGEALPSGQRGILF